MTTTTLSGFSLKYSINTAPEIGVPTYVEPVSVSFTYEEGGTVTYGQGVTEPKGILNVPEVAFSFSGGYFQANRSLDPQGTLAKLTFSNGSFASIASVYNSAEDKDYVLLLDSSSDFVVPTDQTSLDELLSGIVSVQPLTGLLAPDSAIRLSDIPASASVENNVFVGTDAGDVINGGAGDDRLDGGAGNDTLNGGAGNDTIDGGDGDDQLEGGSGNDKLYGDAGNDRMLGGAGNDIYYVDSTGDRVYETKTIASSDETLEILQVNTSGGNSSVSLRFLGETSDGELLLNFSLGLEGWRLDSTTAIREWTEFNYDFLAWSDRVIEVIGKQEINSYSDFVSYFSDIIEFDLIADAGGTDRIYSTVNVNMNAYNGVKHVEHLTLQGISNIYGYGNDNNNTIVGNVGNNSLKGGAGNDYLNGGSGNDTLDGEAGDDTLDGGAGNDTLTGGEGSDTFIFRGTFDHDIITDFDETDDTLNFYTSDGSVLQVSDMIETINSDGHRVLSTTDGLSSVTFIAPPPITSPPSYLPPVLTGFSINSTEFSENDILSASITAYQPYSLSGTDVEFAWIEYTTDVGDFGDDLDMEDPDGDGIFTFSETIDNIVPYGEYVDPLDDFTDENYIISDENTVAEGTYIANAIYLMDADFNSSEYHKNGSVYLNGELQGSQHEFAISSLNFVVVDNISETTPAFDIALASTSNNVTTFEIYADASVDPDNDGIGSFEFTLSHDPSDLLIDIDSFAAASGISGVPNYDATTGTLEAAAFAFPNFEDLSAPIATFSATILDTDNPVNLTISNAIVDRVAQDDVVETFDFSSVSITTTIVDRFGDDLVLQNDDVFAFEISGGDQVFVREKIIGSDTSTVIEIVANPTSEFSALDFDLTDYAGLTDFTLSDALSNWTFQTNETVADQVSFSGFSNNSEIPAGQETVLATFTTAIDPDFDISGIKLDGAAEPDISVGEIPAASTNGNVTVFEVSSGTGAFVNAYKPIDEASEDAIGAYDALQALRLAVGLTKSDGTAEWHDYLAADINKDGRVGADDALDILKFAVGLTDGSQADWVFVDGDADWSGVTRSNTSYEEGVMLEDVLVDTSINMTGILVGDLDGSYVA